MGASCRATAVPAAAAAVGLPHSSAALARRGAPGLPHAASRVLKTISHRREAREQGAGAPPPRPQTPGRGRPGSLSHRDQIAIPLPASTRTPKASPLLPVAADGRRRADFDFGLGIADRGSGKATPPPAVGDYESRRLHPFSSPGDPRIAYHVEGRRIPTIAQRFSAGNRGGEETKSRRDGRTVLSSLTGLCHLSGARRPSAEAPGYFQTRPTILRGCDREGTKHAKHWKREERPARKPAFRCHTLFESGKNSIRYSDLCSRACSNAT